MSLVAFHGITLSPVQTDFTMHIHHDCELFCFLRGNASYSVEGNLYPLRPGDVMLMRPSEAHHLLVQGNTAYERMVVNFPLSVIEPFDPSGRMRALFLDRPLGEQNRFPAVPDGFRLYCLGKICSASTEQERLIYLLPLLTELTETVPTEPVSSDKSAEIIRYIDRHLFEDLSLDKICDRFFLCKTHLNRIFKATTGSTVWNYIATKRLLHARRLLQDGELPTHVYEQCGYTDYASFYKAFRKQFGYSPSERK